MKITIMGPPGGGKGTQAEIISAKLKIEHISTGAIIRSEIRNETKLGIIAKKFIDSGELVPDEHIVGMVVNRLMSKDCEKGYILDGFPRTLPQAEALEASDIRLDYAINLSVSDDEIVQRLGGRRECKKCAAPYHVQFNPPKVEGVCDVCGGELITREDDVPETIRKRLSVYHKQTEPLVNFYKDAGILVDIEGADSIEETTAKVLKALGV